jgi:hypothetical protein
VPSALATTTVILAITVSLSVAARADHKCDPLSDADIDWNVVATHEIVSQVDSTPYQAGEAGNWYVDRATTVLPFCNYYNAVGNYSMRSYSLTEQVTTERIGICRRNTQGGSVPVVPYAGPCPPR